jgi:glutaredoxin-like protein NrdH
METKKLVTVYTQPDCRPCKRVISKLEQAGIEIEVVDLSRDLLAKDYVTRVLRVSSTPIVEAYGFLPIVGYQPDKLKELIEEIRFEQIADEIHDYVYEGEEE